MKTVSIIGSAGRKEDSIFVTKSNFNRMIQLVTMQLTTWFPNEAITLVSGGAAFADHVAVALWLETNSKKNDYLKLCLPCKWDANKNKFFDNGSSDFRLNPGKTANYYHECFSRAISIDSFTQLAEIYKRQKPPQICWLDHYKGFFDRNSMVSKSDYIIAFTNSSTGQPKDGGTADTWNKATTINKIHFDLGNL